MFGTGIMRNLNSILKSGLLALPLLGLIVLALYLTAGATVVFESGSDYVIRPQYERTLDRVLLTLSTSTDDLSNHQSIIKSLPDYTEIIMLMPEQRGPQVSRDLERMGIAQRVKMVPFKTRRMDLEDAFVLSTSEQRIKPLKKKVPLPRGTVWAQDLFKAATAPDGSCVILTPFIHKIFIHKDDVWGGKLFTDNRFVSRLESEGIYTRNLSEVFKGGNVLVDEFRGKRIAFVGGDVIRDTIMVMSRTTDGNITDDDVVERLRDDLKVERVVIIGGDEPQPLKMFHLDQAMVLLGGGVAGVTRVVDWKEGIIDHDLNDVDRFLSRLRDTLTRLGYTIMDMDATIGDVLDYRYYVNGVPYINRRTKQREFLFPMFKSSLRSPGRDIYLNNIKKLEKLGYRVLPVYTESNRRHGGLHCMVNVIS
jgi:hypothetical protein